MSMLTPEQRACLLDHLGGMRAKDIANKYDVKKPVVYNRIREAKRIIDTGSAHSEDEIELLLRRKKKIETGIQIMVDDEEEEEQEYQSYHGFGMGGMSMW